MMNKKMNTPMKIIIITVTMIMKDNEEDRRKTNEQKSRAKTQNKKFNNLFT